MREVGGEGWPAGLVGARTEHHRHPEAGVQRAAFEQVGPRLPRAGRRSAPGAAGRQRESTTAPAESARSRTARWSPAGRRGVRWAMGGGVPSPRTSGGVWEGVPRAEEQARSTAAVSYLLFRAAGWVGAGRGADWIDRGGVPLPSLSRGVWVGVGRWPGRRRETS
eukprot:scaffold10996_cov90-Isochrysis_galbana.AAC.4